MVQCIAHSTKPLKDRRLIFYSHDVATPPSSYECSPSLLRHTLEAASRRSMPIVSVAEASRRAGAWANLAIDHYQRGLPEVRQPFFPGDGLGFFGFHVGDHGKQDEAASFSRYDEVLRNARPVGILAGGKSPEHDVAVHQLAGAAGSKLALAIPRIRRHHGGGDVETLGGVFRRNDPDETDRLVGPPRRAGRCDGNRRFSPAQDPRVTQRGPENEIRRQFDGFDLHFR